MRARDGIELHERHWCASGEAWAQALLIHGLAEHIGRYERVGRILAEAGLDVHGFDLRGYGRSGGPRAYVDRWDDYLDDVEEAIRCAREASPADGGRPLPLALIGHSMGALIALTYACSDRPLPDLLVLSAPPLDAAVPAWQRLAAPALSRVAPKLMLDNPFAGDQLSRDPAVAEAYLADPLVWRRSTARLGAEFMGAMRLAGRRLGRLRVPTLVIHGADDTLVPTRVSEPLAGLSVVERRVLPGLRHETMNEPEGPEVVAGIVEWLREHTRA